ncbi:MAG: cache domain-containing protein, partial [Gammaproteobacteria bacterium]|nr:cache domain-containing protein [Gammaproteobacteria bacterium]
EGRDVHDVALTDFDGRPIFSSLKETPSYKDSGALRAALNQGVVGQELDPQRKVWQVYLPVLYYSTTQGALLLSYDLPALARRILNASPEVQYSLRQGDKLIYRSDNPLQGELLTERRKLGEGGSDALSHLGLELEVALSRDDLLKPANVA